MHNRSRIRRLQFGASLIEVLVAVLLLSFGMLSLGAMMAFSVQMPKLSGYRTTATNIASDHIERIRANAGEFALGTYSSGSSYDGTFNDIPLNNCAYPNCTASTLATMDIAATRNAVRVLLPAGGMLVTCDAVGCGNPNAYGNLWIVWQEPSTSAALNPTSSDNCPAQITNSYTNPAPRCLYVRFKP
jgi:type IV pilus assembly protein PilV